MENDKAFERLSKIRRVSRIVKGVSGFFLVVICIGFLIGAVGMISGQDELDIYLGQQITVDAGEVPLATKLIVIVGFGAVLSLLFKSFFHVYKLFDGYSRGQIFTADSVRHFKRIAQLTLVWGLFRMAVIPILSVALQRSIGSESVDVSVSLPFFELFLGGILITIAWVMEIGYELREERDLVI